MPEPLDLQAPRLEPGFPLEKWAKLLASGQRLRLRMESADMAPAVQVGDALDFAEPRLMDLKRGDLVLVYTGGACRLRRVQRRLVATGGELFEVAADALDVPPVQVGFEEVLGVLVDIEREGERLGPRGGSPKAARARRRFRERVKELWITVLLRFGR